MAGNANLLSLGPSKRKPSLCKREFGDEIAYLVLEKDYTRAQVYKHLVRKYGAQHGLSLRSVKTFCTQENIHRADPNSRRSDIIDGFKLARAKVEGNASLVADEDESEEMVDVPIPGNGQEDVIVSEEGVPVDFEIEASQQDLQTRQTNIPLVKGVSLVTEILQNITRLPTTAAVNVDEAAGDMVHVQCVTPQQPTTGNAAASSSSSPSSSTAAAVGATSSAAPASVPAQAQASSSAAQASASTTKGSANTPKLLKYTFSTKHKGKIPNRKQKKTTVVLDQDMTEYQRQKLRKMDVQNQLLGDLCNELQILRSGLFAAYDVNVKIAPVHVSK